MIPISKIEESIVDWNIKFPLDRWWRKKYNIPFGSERHLEVSQIDIIFDYLEDKLVEKSKIMLEDVIRREGEYKKGVLINTEGLLSEKEKDDLFDSLDFSKMKDSSNKIEIEE